MIVERFKMKINIAQRVYLAKLARITWIHRAREAHCFVIVWKVN